MSLCLGEWLAGDVREVKDPEFVTSPVVGYVCFARKGVVGIPCQNRTEAKVFNTENEAIEYIGRCHRRSPDKFDIRV